MASAQSFILIFSISLSLLASGGIAALTFFSVPSLQALPASQSLPQTRWLFSRGSHIFPAASFVSGLGFASLAVLALPPSARTAWLVLRHLGCARAGRISNGYLAASALCLSIAAVTQFLIPENFNTIEMKAKFGGVRSELSAKVQKEDGNEKSTSSTAEDSVSGKGQPSQIKDLSGPQAKTEQSITEEEDREVRRLLEKFGRMNLAQAVLIGAGGIVGLATALA